MWISTQKTTLHFMNRKKNTNFHTIIMDSQESSLCSTKTFSITDMGGFWVGCHYLSQGEITDAEMPSTDWNRY